MKITFNQHKGKRVCSGHVKYHKKRIPFYLYAICGDFDYWWSKEINKWVFVDEDDFDINKPYSSSSCEIRSIKAFRRRLKQWSKYMPKGTEFELVSSFNRCDVFGAV